jgi:hypothetical protein
VIKMELLLGIVAFALWVFCLVDAIGSPADRIRNLPKAAWVVIILLFPLVGSVLWLAVGRPDHGVARRSPHERPPFPEYDRPGRAAAVDPEKDAEFLRQVRERAEAQRKAYDEQRKREREADEGAGEG